MLEPLRLSDDEFHQLCQLVEEGLSSGELWLAARFESFSPFELQLKRATTLFDVVNDQTQSDRLQNALTFLDDLMFLAFERAPVDVIESWANQPNEDLSKIAVERVEYMGSTMPTLGRLWRAKLSSALPILGNVSYEFFMFARHSLPSAFMSFSTAKVRGLNISEQGGGDLTIRLWADDLYRLRDQIDHILEKHVDLNSELEEEVEP
jgi:hypothetical protein